MKKVSVGSVWGIFDGDGGGAESCLRMWMMRELWAWTASRYLYILFTYVSSLRSLSTTLAPIGALLKG